LAQIEHASIIKARAAATIASHIQLAVR